MSIEVDIELPTLRELQIAFKELPNNIAAKHMAAALGRAINPALKRLKANTPKGPTGNLRRAVKKKTVKYTKDGAGVAIIGYVKKPRGEKIDERSDSFKGYHAHLVEKGTASRQTKGRLASSYKTRGPFDLRRYKSKAKRGVIRTAPKPPKAFLKGTFSGGTVDLGKMRAGGKSGKPPLETTFKETKSQLERATREEMSQGVLSGLKEMAGKFRTTGSR